MIKYNFPTKTEARNDYQDYVNEWIVDHRLKDVRIVLGPEDETKLGKDSVNQLILEEEKHFDDIDKSNVQVVQAKTKTVKKYLPDTRESLKKPKQVPPKKVKEPDTRESLNEPKQVPPKKD